MNIVASSTARTASAPPLSGLSALPKNAFAPIETATPLAWNLTPPAFGPAARERALLHRVDLLEQARRPGLGFVGSEVDLLRVIAERGDVRRVHVGPLLLEALGQLGLALQVLGGAPRDGLVGGGLERLLLRGVHPVPRLHVDGEQVEADEVRGHDDLR